MRKILLMMVLSLALTPAIASTKLPFFGLDVDPIRPDVGEPTTLTMTCYDERITRNRRQGAWDRRLGQDGVGASTR